MLKQPVHLLMLALAVTAGVAVGVWLGPQASSPQADAAPTVQAAPQAVSDGLDERVAALETERDEWRTRYEELAAAKIDAALRGPAPAPPPPPPPAPITNKRVTREKQEPAAPQAEPDPRALGRPLRYTALRGYRPYRAYRALKVGTKDGVEIPGGADDCQKHAADWLCRGTEASCKEFADTGECYGTEAHCTRYDTSDYCAGTEVFCKRAPTHRTCTGTAVWCLRNRSHDLCRGTKDDCEEQPRAAFCEGTVAFCDRRGGRFDMPFFCDPDPT